MPSGRNRLSLESSICCPTWFLLGVLMLRNVPTLKTGKLTLLRKGPRRCSAKLLISGVLSPQVIVSRSDTAEVTEMSSCAHLAAGAAGLEVERASEAADPGHQPGPATLQSSLPPNPPHPQAD